MRISGTPLRTSELVIVITILFFVRPTESSGEAPVPVPPESDKVSDGLILSIALSIVPDLLELPAKSVTSPTNFTLGVSDVAKAVPRVM